MEHDTKYIVTNCIILFILMIAVAEISYISKNNTIVVNNIHKIQSILVRKLSFWLVASVLLNIVATTRRNASNTRRCNDVSVTRSGNTANTGYRYCLFVCTSCRSTHPITGILCAPCYSDNNNNN